MTDELDAAVTLYGDLEIRKVSQGSGRVEEEGHRQWTRVEEICQFSKKWATPRLASPPASALLKQAAGIAKGSSNPSKESVGTVTLGQVRDIAKVKMEDLNAENLDMAVNTIKGSAKSMGIKVEG